MEMGDDARAGTVSAREHRRVGWLGGNVGRISLRKERRLGREPVQVRC